MRFGLLVLFLVYAATSIYGGQISGRVLDKNQNPIGAVSLELLNFHDRTDTRNAISSATGFFIFKDLKPGTYTLKAEKEDWVEWTSKKIIINAENSKRLMVMMQAIPMDHIVFVHICCILGALIVSYSIFIFNFFIVPIPQKNTTIQAWMLLAGILLSSFFSLQVKTVLLVASAAIPLPLLITWRGNKRSREKIKNEEKATQEFEKMEKAEAEKDTLLGGQKGEALTDLKPFGNASITIQNIEVMSCSGFIPKGTAIVVKGFESGRLLVELAD